MPELMGKLGTPVNGPEGLPPFDGDAWERTDWRHHEEQVRRLRGRIFKAVQEGDWPVARSLQKLALRSWSNTVLLQLRSASFCRLLATGQSPSWTALKILPRSRRTCSSWCRQSVRSQASPSNGGRPSGPFTGVPNLPISSGIYARSRLKGSPAHVSALSSPVARPASGPVIRGPSGRSSPVLRSRFPAAFRPPGIRFIGTLSRHGNSAPITVGLPHHLRIPAPGIRTHSRVYTFRTRETRTGPAALYTPGTAVSTRPGSIPGRRLPHLSGMSLSSRQN